MVRRGLRRALAETTTLKIKSFQDILRKLLRLITRIIFFSFFSLNFRFERQLNEKLERDMEKPEHSPLLPCKRILPELSSPPCSYKHQREVLALIFVLVQLQFLPTPYPNHIKNLKGSLAKRPPLFRRCIRVKTLSHHHDLSP